MFVCTDYLKALEKMARPKDLVKTPVILEDAVQLRSTTKGNTDSLDVSEILYRNTKGVKKHVKSPWDVDIKGTGPGYFDDAGNYILSKPKTISATWILKRGDVLEGPFSEKEFNTKLRTVDISEYMVKRDLDKGFVSLSKLIEDVPSLEFKELNKFFSKNQIVEERKKEQDSFFETSIVNEKNTRLSNFLKNHEISASVDYIIKSIKNMRKADAIEVVKDITGLSRCVNEDLVDLIVGSAGCRILSDVDKDGFSIVTERKSGRRK